MVSEAIRFLQSEESQNNRFLYVSVYQENCLVHLLSDYQGEMTYVKTLDGGTTEKRTLVTLDGVEHVSAEGGGGPADTALLYDSAYDDTFVSRPEGAEAVPPVFERSQSNPCLACWLLGLIARTV